MLYEKIEQAKQGKTVTIYPDELHDPFSPFTIADLVSMCETFSLQYTLIDSPPSFKIFTNANCVE